MCGAIQNGDGRYIPIMTKIRKWNPEQRIYKYGSNFRYEVGNYNFFPNIVRDLKKNTFSNFYFISS